MSHVVNNNGIGNDDLPLSPNACADAADCLAGCLITLEKLVGHYLRVAQEKKGAVNGEKIDLVLKAEHTVRAARDLMREASRLQLLVGRKEDE